LCTCRNAGSYLEFVSLFEFPLVHVHPSSATAINPRRRASPCNERRVQAGTCSVAGPRR
jgi:hypothetical protein